MSSEARHPSEATPPLRIRGPVRWLINVLALAMLGWAAYVIYSWSTWTGLWATVAEWTSHVEYIGSTDQVYDQGFTLVLCMGVVEILLGATIVGVVLLEWRRTARRRAELPKPAPQP